MRKLCYIVGAGNTDFLSLYPDGDDLIIAADGGYEALVRLGINPHFALGDFDSLGYVPENTEHLAFPPEKDDTDMRLAISEARERGYENIMIYGGLGGRLDHTLGNIQNLLSISRWGRGWLWGEGTAVTVITDGTVTFPGKCKGTFSVLAIGGEAAGVTLKDCRYAVSEISMYPDVPLGVSNEFIGAETRISVKDGSLLVLWYCSAKEMEEMIKEGYC